MMMIIIAIIFLFITTFIILSCHWLFAQDNDDLLASSWRGISEENKEDEGGEKQENIPHLEINFTSTMFVISYFGFDQDYQNVWWQCFFLLLITLALLLLCWFWWQLPFHLSRQLWCREVFCRHDIHSPAKMMRMMVVTFNMSRRKMSKVGPQNIWCPGCYKASW